MLNIYKQTVHDVTVVQKCQNLFKSSLLKLSSKTMITSVTLRSEAVCRFVCEANGIQNWNLNLNKANYNELQFAELYQTQ